MMRETILFSFPSISLAPPLSTSSQGLLVLTSSSQPTDFDNDIYLRLQHTPDNEKQSHKTDCLIEAWRELRKISPREFILATEFGDLTITFPELHHLIPQSDSRIDLPAEAKRGMTWEAIVRSFETEVDRFVSYTKNEYSLINSPFGDGGEKNGKAREAGYAGESAGIKPYDPSTFSSTYGDEKRGMGRLVLVDEENGNEVGETQVNSIGVVPGSKGAFFAPRNESGLRLRGGDDGDVDEDDEDDDTTQWTDDLEVLDPVEITFPENGESGPVTVRTADYLRDATDPAYQNSSLVQTAATVSRLIVTTSAYISNAMATGARTFSEKTQPNATPMTFQPSTHQRFQQVHTLTATAAKFSSVTVGKVSTLAQNAGAKLARKDKESAERGKPRNPNILNKSLIAFSTVADSIDYASKSLLNSSSQAATQVVSHRYGEEAGGVARNLTGSFKNVGLVYIDASGVSRRAVVRGVAKGMVVGKVRGGGEVVVPSSSSGATQIDGLPLGWGDGPLGGAYAGPPSGRSTPVPHLPPPGYGESAGSSSLYFAPPPGKEGSPVPQSLSRHNTSEKGEFRF